MTRKLSYMFFTFSILWRFSNAQLTVVQGADMESTPEQLIRNHLVGKGVTISNVTLNGSSGTIFNDHAGYFQTSGGAYEQLGMRNGILLTTGKAGNAIGPNDAAAVGSKTFSGNDPDLEILNDRPVFDACVIEFDFIPQCDTISFRYVFGSEEFYKFCDKDINDVFGFFLSGPGIEGPYSGNGINIARMPNNVSLVSINNLCVDTSVLRNNKDGLYYQYNALTCLLTAWHVVIPFQTYHIKLAIGDDVDAWYDSGVFLEMGSFSAGFDFSVQNIPSNPQAGVHGVEDCNNIAVYFILPVPARVISTIEFTTDGSAINGIDYTEIPCSVTFQPGEDSAVIIIEPLGDTLDEGAEMVVLKILRNNCSGVSEINDTVIIMDNAPMSVNAGNDMTVCPGDTIKLAARVSGGFAPYSWHWNNSAGSDSILYVFPLAGINFYKVLVNDRCGIESTDTVILNVEHAAFLTNQPAAKEICEGNSTGIKLNSNISQAFFSWTPVEVSGNVSGYRSGSGEIIDQVLHLGNSDPGSVIFRIMISGKGCDTSFADYQVTVNPLPLVELGSPGLIVEGSVVDLHAGGGYAEYLWSTGQNDSVISVAEAGSYWVQVKNNHACQGSDTIIVNEFGLYIPNAFTPDNDGLNDIFRIKEMDPEMVVQLQIFDRWGEMVFETSDPGKGWDGSFRNQPCRGGTYVWVLRVYAPVSKFLTGTVTLIR